MPTGWNKTLCGEMEDPLWLNLTQRLAYRRGVLEIALDELDLSLEMLDILCPTAPSPGSEDLHIGVFSQQIVRQVGARKTRYTGDKHTHD